MDAFFPKNRFWLIGALLFAIIIVFLSVFLHQLTSLFKFTSLYFTFCATVLGISFVFTVLQRARKDEQDWFWQQKVALILTTTIIVLPALGIAERVWKFQIGGTGVQAIDFVEMIVISILLVILLTFDILVTIRFISLFTRRKQS